MHITILHRGLFRDMLVPVDRMVLVSVSSYSIRDNSALDTVTDLELSETTQCCLQNSPSAVGL